MATAPVLPCTKTRHVRTESLRCKFLYHFTWAWRAPQRASCTMNPLTQIKNTQKITRAEHAAGVGDSASWHARFKHSAYVFAGGLPYELTEGDVLAVFAQASIHAARWVASINHRACPQYGEVVDVNLIRDRQTNKSRGFCFLAYEDQRSTVLAVDNLSGARVGGRIINVTHVDNYKRRKAEITGEEESESEEEESEEEEEEDEEPEKPGPGASSGAA